jgi:3D (Asp-Asp-Asp) domain-containing protein
MLISRSLSRKALATLGVVVGFVLLYETTTLDSRFALTKVTRVDPGTPAPGARLKFGATAYCKGRTTASGVNVRSGIAAADPALLPVGSVVQVDAPGTRHDGVYTIMDTGPMVKGKRLDLYMWSCHEALDFGYATVDLSVLRLGWSPQASEPTLIGRLFRRREAAKRAQAAEEAAAAADAQVPPSTLPDPEGESEPPSESKPSQAPAATPEPEERGEAPLAEAGVVPGSAAPPSRPKRSRSPDSAGSSPSR